MRKIYVINWYGSTEPNLINCMINMKKLEEYIEQNPSNEAEDQYRYVYTDICNDLRKAIGTKNLLTIGLRKNNKEVIIGEFDRIALQGNYYKKKFDDTVGNYYIEVDED